MMHPMGLGFFWFLPVLAVLVFSGFGIIKYVVRRLNFRDKSRRGAVGRIGYSSNTESAVYRLAQNNGGRLTVSDLVIDSGLPPSKAEKLLQSLTDGQRVRMEVTNTGTIVYEFPELIADERENGKKNV